MGCAGSRVPNAEEYLSIEQPAPAEGYLVAGWPSSIKMTGWSFCQDYHSADDAVSTMMMLSSDDPGGVYHETRGAGPGGVGVPEELAITDLDGTPLGTMFMPKHLSFGVGAQLKDSTGNIIALLRTGETKRAQGAFSSSYDVLVPRPQFQGQAPVAGNWYVWAKVKRAPFTSTVKISNGQGAPMGKGHTYMGYAGGGLGAQKWKCESESGQGLMLCLPTAEQPKRHHIQCSVGADVALQVCLMYAAKLANDELYQPRPREGGGGDDD